MRTKSRTKVPARRRISNRRARWAGALALALWLALCAPLAIARGGDSVPGDIDAMLQHADTVRSSDPREFADLLTRLRGLEDEATALQKDRIAYLFAYKEAFTGHYDKALVDLQRLAARTQDRDVRFRANALLINTYAMTRQFTQGLRALEQLLPQIDAIDDRGLRAHALSVAALLYNQVGQYNLARAYADRLLDGDYDARTRCFAGQYKLEALQNLGTLPNDDRAISRVIEQCLAQRELVVANLARGHLARKWAGEGQRKRAIALLQAHLGEMRATGYAFLIGQTYSQLAEYLFEEGDLDGAAAQARVSLSQRADVQLTSYLVSAHNTLYQVAERRGDLPVALAEYRKFAEADKAYLNEVKARELAYQIVRQETAQKSQQIELLDRKNQVLQLQQKVNAQEAQSSRLMILLLIVLVTSIGYWAYKTRRMHASLRRMAETDVLTSVCNRRHFQQQAELLLQQSARAGEDVALVMFDLDHFKSINDRFGHTTGDWVLRHVAESCGGVCRKVDRFGRLGGEEFAILLPGCDLRAAIRIAEDCRVRLASIDTAPSGYKFLVTASFGVTATKHSGYDLAKLLSHADMLLYRAKREGRNRVCRYDGEMQTWVQPTATDAERSDETQAPALA